MAGAPAAPAAPAALAPALECLAGRAGASQACAPASLRELQLRTTMSLSRPSLAALGPDQDRALVLAVVRDLELVVDLAQAQAQDPGQALAQELDLDQDPVQALDLVPAPAPALAPVPAPALVQVRMFAIRVLRLLRGLYPHQRTGGLTKVVIVIKPYLCLIPI